MELPERLQKILTYSRLSVRRLAIKCGLKQQTLDKHIKGIAEPSAATLIGIATAYPEISTDWLLLGIGSMLRGENKEFERVNNLVDTISMLQDALKAKSQTISALTDRVKQLETQISK